MTDDRNQEGASEDGAPSGDEPMSVEGPDVETSLSDADRAFLDGASDMPQGDQEDEHLADLRRVTAEYANYRRRVERDRVVERERAVGDAVRAILPVLDDLDRAEAHGDLVEGGPFTAIATKLRASVGRLGVTAFGASGEAFDPHQHDAIFQRESPDVQRATVSDVVERGYRSGDTILRAAKVVVDTPAG